MNPSNKESAAANALRAFYTICNINPDLKRFDSVTRHVVKYSLDTYKESMGYLYANHPGLFGVVIRIISAADNDPIYDDVAQHFTQGIANMIELRNAHAVYNKEIRDEIVLKMNDLDKVYG
jgi:hypothetical protein